MLYLKRDLTPTSFVSSFKAAYQTTLADAVRYADDLLEEVKSKFCNEFSSVVGSGGKKHISLATDIDFSERFDSLLRSVEEKYVPGNVSLAQTFLPTHVTFSPSKIPSCLQKGPEIVLGYQEGSRTCEDTW